MLLPSSATKLSVWELYHESAVMLNETSVSYVTFCRLWRQQLPELGIMKPASDLCHKCQSNVDAIRETANATEEEKEALLEKHMEHLRLSKVCRQLYRDQCQAAKETWANLVVHPNELHESVDTMIHVSFDYAQQVKHTLQNECENKVFINTIIVILSRYEPMRVLKSCKSVLFVSRWRKYLSYSL